MKPLNNKTYGVISVSIPILKKLPDDGFSLDIGSLTLSLGGRNFILDSTNSDFNNGQKKGSDFEFSSTLLIDKDTFEEGEEYNYELTEEDLNSEDLKAEFFCSDQDAGIDDAFDFDNAEIDCEIFVNGKAKKIKVVFDF